MYVYLFLTPYGTRPVGTTEAADPQWASWSSK
jgi:hypothetical protein